MFQLFNRIQLPLFSPDGDGGPTTLDDKEMSIDDAVDFLGDDDTDEKDIIDIGESKGKKEDKETPPKETKKEGKDTPKEDDESSDEEESDEESEEPDELAELEAELEEPADEDLELVTPVRRREILAKYPQLFKDFPYLEKAYYREQQYTEIFPTLEDARTAVEKGETLDNFQQDVMGGDIGTILKTVRESNPNSFYRIVDSYLPTLSQVDQQAYFHVLGNIGKMTIASMVQEAKRSNNEELQKAAHILNQFMFGTSEWKPPTQLSREERQQDNVREREISDRERQFVTQQFTSTRDELNSRVNNTLMNTINAHIDPKNTMPPYVKKNASKDAMDTLGRLINQDGRFRGLVDKLWDRAFQSNFAKVDVDRIRAAYTAKAKTLLLPVIKRARNEALRGIGKRVRDEATGEERPRNKGPVPGGRATSQPGKGGKVSKAEDIPKGMSTLEFLNTD